MTTSKKKRDILFDFLKENNKDEEAKDCGEMYFFHSPVGLRLNYTGYKTLKPHHRWIEFKLTRPLLPSEVLKIEKNTKFPYFLSLSKVALFDMELCFMVKLVGSIEDWLRRND